MRIHLREGAQATDLVHDAAIVTKVLDDGAPGVVAQTVGAVYEAAAGDGRIRFAYLDQHGHTSRRLVDPYRLPLRGAASYLVGHDDWPTFRFDRISDVVSVPGTYRRRRFPHESLGGFPLVDVADTGEMSDDAPQMLLVADAKFGSAGSSPVMRRPTCGSATGARVAPMRASCSRPESRSAASYARVSSIPQHTQLQRDALAEVDCVRVFEDKICSRTKDRPGLLEALDHLRAGDTLCIWKLDRQADP